MKTNLLSCFILSFFILSFSSCNPKKAIEDKISETIAEKMAGTMLGTDVETSNLTNAENAKAEVDIKVDGKSITYKNAKPIFTIAKGNNEDINCSLSLVEEGDNTTRTIQIGLLGQKNLFKTPLTANINTQDEEGQVKASFSIVDFSESGMSAMMTKSGTIKVVSFSDEEVIFEIDAKGEEMNESKTPFSITGKIVCKNPMATYIGLKKEEIF